MPEDSATDRASALLRQAIADPGRFTTRWYVDGAMEPLYVMQARACVEALTSDPSLLADWDLEAGGLEQVGWTNPDALYLKQWWPEPQADDEVAVYRRKEQSQPDHTDKETA